ncbi:MAG: LysM peptidoglycan-binding domain-containing protein [Candidatus Omnitrophota bacterium]
MVVKRYVPVFGPPLLIVAVFFLLFRPAYLSLNRIKKEISVKNKDLQESRAIVGGKKEIFAVFREIQKKDAFYRVYFSPLEETDILRRMAKIANRSNILYTKLTPLSQLQTATPASSTQGQAPSSTQGQAPSSTQGQAPSSTQGQAPSSTQGQAPSSTQGQAPSATFDIRTFVFTFTASYTQFSEVLTQLAKLDRFVTVRSFKIDTKEDKVNPQPYNPKTELTIDFYSRPVSPASSVQGQAPAPAAKSEPKKAAPAVQRKETKIPHPSLPPGEGGVVGGTTYYTVCPGDSLIKIAHRYGMNVWELRNLNNMPKKSRTIRPGDKIIVKKDEEKK